jgi:hypothetical protein
MVQFFKLWEAISAVRATLADPDPASTRPAKYGCRPVKSTFAV